MTQNNSLDKKILSYMLQSKQCALEVSSKTSFEYIVVELQWFYKFIVDYFTNPKFREIPTLTITEEFLRKNYTQETFINNSIELYKELSTAAVEPTEFNWYFQKLKTRYNEQVQNNCLENATNIIKSCPNYEEKIEKVNDVLRRSLITIDSINKKESYKEGSLQESARDRANWYKAVEANPDIAKGLYTGLTEFDRITNGLYPGELVIIGGRSSTGKSIMMQNMAVNVWKGIYNPLESAPDPKQTYSGANVLYFSIEMPKENQERRIDACLVGIPYNDIKAGRLSQEDKAKYFKALKFQDQFSKQLYVVDMPRGVTAREIELKYLELKEKYGITFDLVVVDYMQIMASNEPQKSDWETQGKIAEQLHEFARAYSVPVLTAVQLNRPKDGKDSHSNDRIARSDMIPSNANIILQISNRNDDEHLRLDMPISLIKNRDGEKTSFTLIKNFACMQVRDMVGESITTGDLDDDIGI